MEMFHRFHDHNRIGGSITANNLEDIINTIGIDELYLLVYGFKNV